MDNITRISQTPDEYKPLPPTPPRTTAVAEPPLRLSMIDLDALVTTNPLYDPEQAAELDAEYDDKALSDAMDEALSQQSDTMAEEEATDFMENTGISTSSSSRSSEVGHETPKVFVDATFFAREKESKSLFDILKSPFKLLASFSSSSVVGAVEKLAGKIQSKIREYTWDVIADNIVKFKHRYSADLTLYRTDEKKEYRF